mgnify:CR=1 FL=1
MTTFLLNDATIKTDAHPGTTLLDFIRYGQDLPGTKIGCREGDCGACTVLEGQMDNGKLHYRSIVSCLTPLGNAHGKHIVTVEGINMDSCSPVQQAMVDHNGTQCGFCTPGFIMSLTGHTMAYEPSEAKSAIDSVNGNICRCTGYKSIERAAISISKLLKDKNPQDPLNWLIQHQFLPPYFKEIPEKLSKIKKNQPTKNVVQQIIGGGTDLMVQKPDKIAESSLGLFFDRSDLKEIRREKEHIVIGAAATANDIMHSEVMNTIIPNLKKHFKLISSDPIRNMGTLGGNIVNASPIADLTIYFLALGAILLLEKDEKERELPLKDFFLDYKKMDLKKGEYIKSVFFPVPTGPFDFNFEKVSKRTHLDIATVNAAAYVKIEQDIITECRLAVGGVSPVPQFLNESAAWLTGKNLNTDTIREAVNILNKEILPISDVRGSKEYKRLLARQLFFAHFIELFPDRFSLQELLS